MDKINFQEGMALSYEQLAYMQDAIKTVIGGLASGFGNNFIISGCTRTDVDLGMLGPGYNYAAGWVVINGEICQFDGQSIAISSYPNDASFIVNETNVAPQIEFEDTSLKYVYKSRKAIISNTVGTGNILTFEKSKINDTWKDIDLVAGADAVANYTPQYRIYNGYMELRGRAINSSGGTIHYLSDSAQMYAPVYDQHCPVAVDGLAPTFLRIRLLAADQKLYLANWLNGSTILLDGVRFRLL